MRHMMFVVPCLLSLLMSAGLGGVGHEGAQVLPANIGGLTVAVSEWSPNALSVHRYNEKGELQEWVEGEASLVARYLMAIPQSSGFPTYSTPMVCSCHPGRVTTITTPHSTQAEGPHGWKAASDRHDRKLDWYRLKHPAPTGTQDLQGPGKRRMGDHRSYHERQLRWFEHGGLPGSPAHRYRRPPAGSCPYCPMGPIPGYPSLYPIPVSPEMLRQNGHFDEGT